MTNLNITYPSSLLNEILDLLDELCDIAMKKDYPTDVGLQEIDQRIDDVLKRIREINQE